MYSLKPVSQQHVHQKLELKQTRKMYSNSSLGVIKHDLGAVKIDTFLGQQSSTMKRRTWIVTIITSVINSLFGRKIHVDKS